MNELRYQTQENLNTIQIKLPLEISVKIKNTDPVVTFKEVMEGVNLKKYLVKQSDETRGSAGLFCLWPELSNKDYKEALKVAKDGENPNNISPIIKYSIADGATFLWMGDLESDFQEKIK